MKRIVYLLVSIICAIKCDAQVEISNSQLMGKKWERVLPVQIIEGDTTIITFTKEYLENYHYRINHNDVFQFKHKYYITDAEPSYVQFANENVGKERKGRYIVFYNAKVNSIDFYTVMSLTDNELVLHHKALPKSIPKIDMTIVYKRVW